MRTGSPVYFEIIDFIASGTTPEQVVDNDFIQPITEPGSATVRILRLNASERIGERRVLRSEAWDDIRNEP